jgi:hypothetical protein
LKNLLLFRETDSLSCGHVHSGSVRKTIQGTEQPDLSVGIPSLRKKRAAGTFPKMFWNFFPFLSCPHSLPLRDLFRCVFILNLKIKKPFFVPKTLASGT